jgi:hypothetical protein
LLNRRRAKTSSIAYAGYVDVPGRPLSDDPETELFAPVETNLAQHHKLILEAMERTTTRRYGRLLMMLPPGSAKTTYASIVFPSHYMGKFPGSRLALGSYGSDISLKMGRKTRSIIRQRRYKAIFGTELSQDSRAGNQFSLTNGSEYMADSLGGQFPGNRFDGAIADDPLKGRLEANSELIRNNTWDEFKDNFVTRIVPGGWLVVIMTHWAEEDPAGRILPENWSGDSGFVKGRHDGLDWEVLCIQAKCETTTDPLGRQIGEYLWPEWFDAQHWQQFERDARGWNSLFQQRPRPIEGAFFHEVDLLVRTELLGVDGQPLCIPIDMPQKVDCVYAVIDSAVKTGRAHDGLAVTFFALSIHNPLNPPLAICDWDYTQIQGASLHVWLPSVFIRLEELAKQTGAFQGSKGAFIEDKVSGTILLQQAAQQPDWHPDWIATPIDSKLTMLGKKERALNISGHVAAGKVKWVRQAYERVVTFKNSTKNHLRSQVLNVSMESKDTDADDCLDTFSYGCAIGLGNAEGF